MEKRRRVRVTDDPLDLVTDFDRIVRLFECADERWVFVAARTDEARVRLVGAVDVAVDLDDSEGVACALEARIREDAASAWFERLDTAGVPVEIVDEEFCRDLFDDAVARETGLVARTRAGAVGRFEDVGLLVNLSATPTAVRPSCTRSARSSTRPGSA